MIRKREEQIVTASVYLPLSAVLAVEKIRKKTEKNRTRILRELIIYALKKRGFIRKRKGGC
ncbi:MAG: hypothetical protein ABWK01_07880 [Infirmifilum sp.]